MTAALVVPAEAACDRIAAAAGSSVFRYDVATGTLILEDVEQTAADAALAQVGTAPPPPRIVTVAGDVWRRATPEEGAKLMAMRDALDARMAGLVQAAAYYDSWDEYYPMLLAGFIEAVGEKRARELLAPSEA